ncbi:MAG: type II toxin-antitoxin system RelE/ParE family toxin [Planctomycetes bacterium]|nr:type II toxin-antitoxin system RelE/ParE family toxin [Planctomycetota bacterium]
MYTVRWKRTALDLLTELWIQSDNRSEINDAVDEIDRLLARQPYDCSESRSESIRVLFCKPLGVFFAVDDASSTIDVLRVWTF